MTQSEYSVESSQSEQKIFSDYYTINPPFGNSGIFENKDLGRIEYLLMEPYLDNVEIKLLTSIKTNLIENGNML